MKTLAISFDCGHSSTEELVQVYGFLRQVFCSLPPLHYLAQIEQDNGEAYRAWYASHFTDSSDGWNSGPSLMIGEDFFVPSSEGTTFQLTTPTSGRIIRLRLRKGGASILELSIEFPGGSVHAARKLWDEILFAKIRPFTFRVMEGEQIWTYYGEVAASLKPLQLQPWENSYQGEGLDIEYCLSVAATLAKGLNPMDYPWEYEYRVLAQQAHGKGKEKGERRPRPQRK
jgi:hypothetical protein